MQNKSAAWWAALVAPSVEWRYGVDILAADEVTPLEDSLLYDQNASDRLVPQSSQVLLDASATTHRSFSLMLRNSDGRYLAGIAGYPSGGAGSQLATGLVWYNVRYRPWIDLMTGFDAHGSKVYDRTYLGIYVLTKPESQVKPAGSMMQLNLLDKSALLRKPYVITNSTLPTFTRNGHSVGGYPVGSTFDAAMQDLAIRGGVPGARLNFTPSALTLPADYAIAEGSEWWAHLQTLAASMASVVYFDSLGYLVRKPDPLLQDTPSVYTFQPGVRAIISAVTRDTDLLQTFNHVIAVGGSSTSDTVRGEAQVTDPASPYHKNQIGDRIVYVGKDGKLDDMTPDPRIGTADQATARAQQVLARTIGQLETSSIQGRNIAALEPYDRITVAVAASGLNLDMSVDGVTWNLSHASGGGMIVAVSRWFTIGG